MGVRRLVLLAAGSVIFAHVACSTFGTSEDDSPPPAVTPDGSADDGGDAAALDGGASLIDLTPDPVDDPDASAVGNPSLVPDGGKIVFVTHVGFDGDLGGVKGADDKCQAAAQAAGLPGDYIAYVHTSGGEGSTRFPTAQTWYRLDGQVAFSKVIPHAGNAQAAIDIAEDGKQVGPGVKAWTGENNGAPTLFTCSVWANKTAAATAFIGDVHDSTAWARNGAVRACNNTARIYCFQN